MISAQNSNITVYSFQALNFTRHTQRLRYLVVGEGKQTINLGIVTTRNEQFSSIDWSVVKNNAFLTEGEYWSISQNGTITVTGVIGNVSVVYWGFLENNLPSSNVPFYLQHSVVITIIAATTVMVGIAVALKIGNRGQFKKRVNNGQS